MAAQIREGTLDQTKLEALLKTIGDVNNPDTPCRLVSLEQFFDGNDDGGSIWCNLDTAPEPAEVRKALEGIRARPDVHDVLILVTQWDGEGSWPFADTVLLVTSASAETVESWFGDAYRPDEIYPGTPSHGEPYTPPEDMQVISAWWD